MDKKEPLPAGVRDAILARTFRFRQSVFFGGAVVAALFWATILLRVYRAPDLYLAGPGAFWTLFCEFVWQVGGLLLIFWIYGSIPYARARAMVLRGRLVFGWPVGERTTFGSELVDRKIGPAGVVAAGTALAAGSQALAKRFPSFQQGWVLPWKGKTRWADIWFYEGEEPLLTEDGRGLLLVDPVAWFYPPSPWLLRAEPGSTNEHELREFLDRMHARVEAGEPTPIVEEGPEDAANRTRGVAYRWMAAPALAIIVLYLPIFIEFGWIMVGLMALCILVPIFILGPIFRNIDFSGMIPGKMRDIDS